MDGEAAGGENAEAAGGENAEAAGGENAEAAGGESAETASGDNRGNGGNGRARWPWVFGGVLLFGLLVAASGLILASIPVTVQGAALCVVGAAGLVFTGAVRRPRLPRPVPVALPLGALVLVATAVENARVGLSAWAPLGLLVGAALLSVPIRALPPVQRPVKEPSAAVVLVVIGLVLMVGYEALNHLLTPDAGQLPSYLAAVGMPFAAAVSAGALAVLAATRGGVAGVAAAGALVLVSAGLYMSQAAGDAWWSRQQQETGNRAAAILVQTISTDNYAVAVSFGTYGAESAAATALVVVGLVLTVAGWWWAAARRAAG
ncbi:hypothetical protein [Virgisporangium aurantiacum]|uniref:Uncharacterized protein n=1 Tax=Virgisporangium aurantiacum TaxID=175570 RepID=A0A8J4E369_9ACTN|nr:hypothetical protein [Virgisporangium aurantiacum]GIJ59771.1 hypothetical protein Vau01_072870 [Virgisporangium aurantiacum]